MDLARELIAPILPYFRYLTGTSNGILLLFFFSTVLAYVAAFHFRKLAFAIIFLALVEVGILLSYIGIEIFLFPQKQGNPLPNVHKIAWSLFYSFYAFAFFMLVRVGLIPSLSSLWVKLFGVPTEAVVTKIEDTGMTVATGSGSTNFQASYNAELNRRNILKFTVQYTHPRSGAQMEGEIVVSPLKAPPLQEGAHVQVKVSDKFPRVVRLIS